MESLTNIIIDLLVLSFFALLYYFYTRRRIIHSMEFEFQEKLGEIIYLIHEFLESNKQIESFNEINSFVNDLEVLITKDQSNFPKNLNIPKDLPTDIQNEFEILFKLLN